MEDIQNNLQEEDLQVDSKPLRPELLTVFLILTFIFSGLMSLFSVIGFFTLESIYPMIVEQVPQIENISLSVMQTIMIFVSFFWLLSLAGAVLMFLMKKVGFYLYLFPNGVLLFFQIIGLFSNFDFFTFLFILISALFIFIYAKHFSLMR